MFWPPRLRGAILPYLSKILPSINFKFLEVLLMAKHVMQMASRSWLPRREHRPVDMTIRTKLADGG